MTPLHRAAFYGKAAIVEALLKAGADKGLKDNQGKTALDLASEACDEDDLDNLDEDEREARRKGRPACRPLLEASGLPGP
ncbi:ANKS1A, partial [Symbiodinium sp. CCMP2456]